MPGTGPTRTAAQRFSAAGEALIRAEHRVDHRVRPWIDRLVRPLLQALVQQIALRRGAGLGLRVAEERQLPDEADLVRQIVAQMSAYVAREHAPGTAERVGNTKTYGVVRGVLRVLPDLPPELRRGLFAQEAEHPAWVRFAGPGPASPPDLDDNGILSLGVKVMGVPGPKLLDDEQHTQDFTGISAPTFTTSDLRANLELQRAVYAGTELLHFLRHPVDLVMQGLYAKVHANPLAARYWSCVPYLLGEGQAMQYSFVPSAPLRSTVPRHPRPDYLRDALTATLAAQPVVFDLLLMLQTDPRRMPVEDASVVWPERLSPWRPVATLELPVQHLDPAEQRALARSMSFNPWHCLPEHRPLGNQGRARREIYLELSRLRQRMNGTPHVEPIAPPDLEPPMLFRTTSLPSTRPDAAALTGLRNDELDALFRASPAGQGPGGRLRGTALLFPGTRVARLLARLAYLLVWQGKVTDDSRRSLKNLVGPLRTLAIEAQLSHDRSWVDGGECVLIDYSQTSTIAHMVRDEVRLVAPDLYLGVVWLWRRRVAWFALRSAG